jgi:hypothetical protein
MSLGAAGSKFMALVEINSRGAIARQEICETILSPRASKVCRTERSLYASLFRKNSFR